MPGSNPPTVETLLADADWVQAIARRLVGDAALAQDVAQETWLAALTRGPRDASNLRGWLETVARNATRKLRRSEQRRDQREAVVARTEALPSTYEVVERFSTQHTVASAVLELEEPLRRTVLLRFYEELTLAQIAARTGVAITTVEGRLERGLGVLRRVLDRRHGGDGRAWVMALAPLLPRASRIEAPVAGQALLGALAARCALVLALVGVPLFVAYTLSLASPWQRGAADPALAEARLPQLAPPATTASAAPVRLIDRTAAEASSATIATQVARGGIDLRLRGERGAPVVGARVSLWPIAAPARAALPEPATTDARGRARFDELAPGSYRLEHAFGAATRVEVVAGERAKMDVRVPEGPALAGIVVDANGAAVAGAPVWLSAREPERWIGGRTVANLVELEPFAHTDAEGRFEFAQVFGARRVGASAPGHAPSPALRIGAQTDGLRLELGAAAASLRGVVRDEDGRERAGALVVLDAGGDADCPPFATRSDKHGAFAFPSVLAGRRRLEVYAPGRAPWRETVELTQGVSETVEVELQRGARIEGRLLDADGAACADELIWAAKRRWSALPDLRDAVAARTDARGAFVLEGLAPGTIWLTLERDGAVRYRERLQSEANEALQVERRLARGARLEGTIVDATGTPVAGLRVHAAPAGEHGARRAHTDAEGRFVFEDCRDDLHLVDVRESGALVWHGELEPGATPPTIELEPQARPSARLVGRLLDSDGRELRLSSIRLRTAVGAPRYRLALEEAGPGPFRSAGAPPGTYRVLLVAENGAALTLDGDHELAPSASYDLGTVRIPAPAPTTDDRSSKETDR